MSVNVVLSHLGPFYPGGVISGHVLCVFNSRENVRSIKLKLKGCEHTAWEKREEYYDEQLKSHQWRRVPYSGDNKFLVNEQSIHGSGTISQGQHEYPFQFILPHNIPGTYNGANGHIRYYIKAVVDRPMATDYEFQRVFVVHSPIDFNTMLDKIELNPTQYSDRKTLCCWCCADGPITMEVYLEKEAFILGEKIKLKIDISNMSNQNVDEVNIEVEKFVKEICTFPKHDTQQSSHAFIQETDTGVGAHGQRTYNFDLQIPQTLELQNFTTCELFKQWCKLKIEVMISGCHADMDFDTCINLGHIPARGHEPIINAQYVGSANNTVSPFAPFPPAPSVNTPLLPPQNNFIGVGFVLPGTYPPSAPYPAANAPGDDNAPSAPPKIDLLNDNDFGGGSSSSGPPPPSYSEATRTAKQ